VQDLLASLELLQRCVGLSDGGIQPDESALRRFVQRIDRYQRLAHGGARARAAVRLRAA
jgi:hypothetical protein